MKHLHNFNTVAEYEAVKDTLEMPYIVSIDETDGLQYNTEVIRVPQGSEGSGGENEGSNWRYFATNNYGLIAEVPMFSSLIKVYDWQSNNIQILPLGEANIILSKFELMAMAYNMNQTIYVTSPEGETLTTVGDWIEFLLESIGVGMDILGTEITKEEFYRIPDLSHDGTYIQHINGTLYTSDQWTNGSFSNDDANGVAIIDTINNVNLVVAKDKLNPMPWSSMPDTLIDDIFTTTDMNEIEKIYCGAEDTAIIAAADPNSAAAACMNYTFPNG